MLVVGVVVGLGGDQPVVVAVVGVVPAAVVVGVVVAEGGVEMRERNGGRRGAALGVDNRVVAGRVVAGTDIAQGIEVGGTVQGTLAHGVVGLVGRVPDLAWVAPILGYRADLWLQTTRWDRHGFHS